MRTEMFLPALKSTSAFRQAYSVASTRIDESLDVMSWSMRTCDITLPVLSPWLSTDVIPLGGTREAVMTTKIYVNTYTVFIQGS